MTVEHYLNLWDRPNEHESLKDTEKVDKKTIYRTNLTLISKICRRIRPAGGHDLTVSRNVQQVSKGKFDLGNGIRSSTDARRRLITVVPLRAVIGVAFGRSVKTLTGRTRTSPGQPQGQALSYRTEMDWSIKTKQYSLFDGSERERSSSGGSVRRVRGVHVRSTCIVGRTGRRCLLLLPYPFAKFGRQVYGLQRTKTKTGRQTILKVRRRHGLSSVSPPIAHSHFVRGLPGDRTSVVRKNERKKKIRGSEK